jgi:hypothetical protein
MTSEQRVRVAVDEQHVVAIIPANRCRMYSLIARRAGRDDEAAVLAAVADVYDKGRADLGPNHSLPAADLHTMIDTSAAGRLIGVHGRTVRKWIYGGRVMNTRQLAGVRLVPIEEVLMLNRNTKSKRPTDEPRTTASLISESCQRVLVRDVCAALNVAEPRDPMTVDVDALHRAALRHQTAVVTVARESA